MESDGMLRHLAFFEELGEMDESEAGWRAVRAGLVTMRLVDRWIAAGSTAQLDAWSVSAVREAIAQVENTTPIRRILTSVVDVMVACTATDMHALSPRLMAYGQALEYEAKWSLAADVYGAIPSHAHPVDDVDLVIAASLRVGFCRATLGDWDAAAAAYRRASYLASSTRDPIGVLRAQIGDAKIASARGNMPKAELILEETINQAESIGLDDIRARALTERAFVAGQRGHHDRAIGFSYAALALCCSQRERDRILTNIAAGLREIGRFGPSRDAYLVLAATAQEQYVRWNAELSLMDLAALEGNELQFDRYRRALGAANLTPQLRVNFLMNVGRGYEALGQGDQGISYLDQAMDIAIAHGLNQLVFEIEAAVGDVKRARVRRPLATTFESSQVDEVVAAIESMKQVAGVG